jgi:hypothetical protein
VHEIGQKEKKDEEGMWRAKKRKKKKHCQRRETTERNEIGVITLKETITRFSRFLSPPTPAHPVFSSDTHLSAPSQLRL